MCWLHQCPLSSASVSRNRALLPLLLLAAFLLVRPPSPVMAQAVPQADGWIAWLFEPQTGTLTQIRQDGSLAAEIPLPLTPAFNAFGLNAVVSPSGTHVAYTGVDTLTGPTVNRQVFVFDIGLRSVVATYSLPPDAEAHSLDYALTPLLFDEAARRFAFGYVRVESAPAWEVVVLDYGFGGVAATLNAESPAAAAVSAAAGTGLIVPAVQRYEGGVVTFSAVTYGTEGGAAFPTFAWDVAAGTLNPSPSASTAINDVLRQTGEVIAPGFDERFEAAPAPGGGLPQLNVLTVYVPATGERFPFYHDAARILLGANFAQNGQRVVATAFNPADSSTAWTVIERDGTALHTLPAAASARRVFATADGFIYMDAGETAALQHVLTADDSFAVRTVWQGEPGRFVHVVFVQSLAPAAADFAPWAQLAGPQPIEGTDGG